MLDASGHYAGIVAIASAYNPELPADAQIGTLAMLTANTLSPVTDLRAMLKAFDLAAADELAVVDGVAPWSAW